MTSSLSLPLNPHLQFNSHSFLRPFSPFPRICKPSSSHPPHFKSLVCHAAYPSESDREEARWLREEQRWLREEQRWLREEQRWARERESLLREISDLKLRIQALERRISFQAASPASSSVSDTIADIASLLQVLKDKNNLIAESGSNSRPMVLEEKGDAEVKEVVVEETLRIESTEPSQTKKRKTLRIGSEGDEVREMQEALLKLGFYSGEEDMEYSSFSSGTERAVKTWQATLGATEDGIMTVEMLERLYMELSIKRYGQSDQNESSVSVSPKEGANGASVASLTEISEVQKAVVQNDGATEVSQERGVFLLGENRWEEPSRLVDRDKQVGKSMIKDATAKCLTCRGEGRLMCTECDGTGEPNIEPQFLEWVDESMKCPYCEGLGYTICDVCEGKTVN